MDGTAKNRDGTVEGQRPATNISSTRSNYIDQIRAIITNTANNNKKYTQTPKKLQERNNHS
jgi:hypothetical protein